MKKVLSIMACVLLLSGLFSSYAMAEDAGAIKAKIVEQKEAVKKAQTNLDSFVSRNDPSLPMYSTFKDAFAGIVKDEKKKLRALEKQLKQTKP